jgi:hypothetical protein
VGSFPTNPINALEASCWSKNDDEYRISRFQLIQLTHWKREVVVIYLTFEGEVMFPTNPINALEARFGQSLVSIPPSGGFQLIQLTHWKRVRGGAAEAETFDSFQLIQLTHWKRGHKVTLKVENNHYSFQLIQLTHWKRDARTAATSTPCPGEFPTNPINALEARFLEAQLEVFTPPVNG